MKLAWMFCFLLAGKLSTASPAEQGAEANSGTQYMMAFPLDDDNIAEESAQEAVKMLAESLATSNDEDEAKDEKVEPEEPVVEEEEKKDEEQPEPMGILQAQLDAEEQEEQEKKPALPQRPFFKRPKIEELRKILGFPPQEGSKAKPFPQEKPKMLMSIFNKPKPKMEISKEPSPLGGVQINLRREDRLRPFGFPMLPINREVRPFGFPDLVQAASSLLRRAMVDDENNENDITNKDDKDEEDNGDNNDAEENEEEDGEEDNLMIVPVPDPKEMNMERPPLFRRFPIPFPFPVPKQMPQPQQNNRPRMPFPPLAPVAFFLPIAQQIMQNIRRSQSPMMPMHPAPNFIPMQSQQMPFIHHPMPQQQQQQQQFIPIHHMMPQQQQQFVPFAHVPQASFQVPVLLPNNIQRPMMRQPRRMPMQPQIQRRIPFPNPMHRMPQPQPMPQQFVHHLVRQPMMHAATRPMPQMVRPPMHPVHPVFFMVPHMPMAQHQVPVFQRPPQGFFPHPMPQQRSFPEEEQRVVFIRPDHQEEPQDDDQEVLILVPSDEVEQFQRPPMVAPPPQMMMRQMPAPVSPIQKIRLLRDLLMARQANRQQQSMPMSPRAAHRVVEIVQQQLRIFPAHHQQQQLQHMMVPQHLQRADPSELHPVYVPYPGAH